MHVCTYICVVKQLKLNQTKPNKMKKTAILIALVSSTLLATAQTKTTTTVKKTTTTTTTAAATPSKWNVDASHASVKFTVRHLGVSEVDGNFKMFEGTIATPSNDFNNAAINFTVDVNSINTDNDMRDKHLKSDDFFNAEKFPKMTFVSTSFKKVKAGVYTLEGNLTIRDVTKKVTFAVTGGGIMKDPYGNIKSGFKATGKISRKAFGLKWSAVTEGVSVVSDDVNMVLNLEFAQQK